MPKKVEIYAFGPMVEKHIYTFEIRTESGYKEVRRRVYFNKYDGFFILYRGKHYFEYEFIYRSRNLDS